MPLENYTLWTDSKLRQLIDKANLDRASDQYDRQDLCEKTIH